MPTSAELRGQHRSSPAAYRQHRAAGRRAELRLLRPGPEVGDALLVGLSEPPPRCAVALRFDCQIEGVGVDPTNPPLLVGGVDGDGWVPCEVDRDETGGLNRPGDVVLHLPDGHARRSSTATRPAGCGAGWSMADEDQPVYSSSPLHQAARRRSPSAARSPPCTPSWCIDEVARRRPRACRASGSTLQHPPVSWRRPAGARGRRRRRLGGVGARSRLRRQRPRRPPLRPRRRPGPSRARPGRAGGATGPAPVRRGPAQGRQPPGARLPHRRRPAGQRRPRARSGAQVVDPVRVAGREPAAGRGRGGRRDHRERQGPRRRSCCGPADRAVTAEDYEQLAREAAPEVARVRCVAERRGHGDAAVRVLVVPAAPEGDLGRLALRGAGARRAHPGPGRRLPRRAPGDRHPGGRRAAGLPGRHGRGPARWAASGSAPPGCRTTRWPRCTGTSTRSVAVRTATAGRSAARSVRRGVRGAAAAARGRARRGRPAVPRRPGHRRAGASRRAPRRRPERPRLLLRPPGAGLEG